MPEITDYQVTSALALLGGFATVLAAFYFVEHLSLSIGIYYGVFGALKAYNISPSANFLNVLSSYATITGSLYVSYVMIPLALIIFSVGVLWLFSKSYLKLTSAVLMIASVLFLLLTIMLQFQFNFSSSFPILPISYTGSLFSLVSGSYTFLQLERKATKSVRSARPIHINPETPYSNMLLLSNKLMGRLNGEIKILNMHFDVNALNNLILLTSKNTERYRKISVLTKSERLGGEFDKVYMDFKTELANKSVEFEMRILSENDASRQHERLMLDGSTAYKIPPLNIINKKSEHIVGINYREADNQFKNLWEKAVKFENFKQNQGFNF